MPLRVCAISYLLPHFPNLTNKVAMGDKERSSSACSDAVSALLHREGERRFPAVAFFNGFITRLILTLSAVQRCPELQRNSRARLFSLPLNFRARARFFRFLVRVPGT